jgi:hypothetical protein
MIERYLRNKEDKFKVIGICIAEPMINVDGKVTYHLDMKVGSEENPIALSSYLDELKKR